MVAYADAVLAAGKTPTYARPRFAAVTAILNYPTKRGKWAEDCKWVTAFCAVMVPPKKSATDPKPITPEEFTVLVADVRTRALLLALNACMYGGETAAVQWEDIDLNQGTPVSTRSKTGIARIATLWFETIAALKQLPAAPQPCSSLTSGRRPTTAALIVRSRSRPRPRSCRLFNSHKSAKVPAPRPSRPP